VIDISNEDEHIVKKSTAAPQHANADEENKPKLLKSHSSFAMLQATADEDSSDESDEETYIHLDLPTVSCALLRYMTESFAR
jgi:hypothetical protein